MALSGDRGTPDAAHASKLSSTLPCPGCMHGDGAERDSVARMKRGYVDYKPQVGVSRHCEIAAPRELKGASGHGFRALKLKCPPAAHSSLDLAAPTLLLAQCRPTKPPICCHSGHQGWSLSKCSAHMYLARYFSVSRPTSAISNLAFEASLGYT